MTVVTQTTAAGGEKEEEHGMASWIDGDASAEADQGAGEGARLVFEIPVHLFSFVQLFFLFVTCSVFFLFLSFYHLLAKEFSR
jgi:hypothetical protein